MQQLKEAKIQGNRIEVGEWFVNIVCECDYVIVNVSHKSNGSNWQFDTLEDALEAIK